MIPELGPSRAQVARMRGNITTLILAGQRRRRRRARIALAATAGLVAASLTAGIVLSAIPDDVVAGTYLCFETDDPNSVPHGMPYPMDLEVPDTTAEQVSAAILLCAIAFEREQIVAPDPTVCRLVDRRLGVFPNVERLDDDAFCSALGLLQPED